MIRCSGDWVKHLADWGCHISEQQLPDFETKQEHCGHTENKKVIRAEKHKDSYDTSGRLSQHLACSRTSPKRIFFKEKRKVHMLFCGICRCNDSVQAKTTSGHWPANWQSLRACCRQAGRNEIKGKLTNTWKRNTATQENQWRQFTN